MPKRKIKPLVILPRNSYKGRIKGVLPAFLPGRCIELTPSEREKIAHIRTCIEHLLIEMEKK